MERSTTWPRPVRRTPRRPSIAALNANSDVTWAANCTGVAAATGGRSGKPNVNARPDEAHATRSEPFHPCRGPVRPNGLMATNTWRSWAGTGWPSAGSTSPITTSADASDARVLVAARPRPRRSACPGRRTPTTATLGAVVARRERRQVAQDVAAGWFEHDDVGAQRRPHPGGVGAGQPGQLDDAHARPRPARHGAGRCTAEDLGVVDVRAPQRHLGLRLGERRAARRSGRRSSSGDRPARFVSTSIVSWPIDGPARHQCPGVSRSRIGWPLNASPSGKRMRLDELEPPAVAHLRVVQHPDAVEHLVGRRRRRPAAGRPPRRRCASPSRRRSARRARRGGPGDRRARRSDRRPPAPPTSAARADHWSSSATVMATQASSPVHG